MASPAPEDTSWGQVPCPCGRTHTLSGDAWESYQKQPPIRHLQAAGRTFAVPRIWVAAHGYQGPEIPALAIRYDWDEVDS
jgi:hypothetical protein